MAGNFGGQAGCQPAIQPINHRRYPARPGGFLKFVAHPGYLPQLAGSLGRQSGTGLGTTACDRRTRPGPLESTRQFLFASRSRPAQAYDSMFKFAASLVVAGLAVSASPALGADPAAAAAPGGTNSFAAYVQHREDVRMACIENRRMLCGRILKVLPEGLVLESGYTDLLRAPLNKNWLIPGNVQATLPPNQVEGRAPGAICVGVIFLVDLPKTRGAAAKPRQYDYITLLGYPAGQHTYNSVGDLNKTVRQYSATLQRAVERTLADEEAATPAGRAGK